MDATMLSTPKWLNHLLVFLVNMTLALVCCCQAVAQPTSQAALSSFSASQIEQMLEIRELAQSKGEFGTINIDAIKQLAAELKNREKPLEIESADLWAIVQDNKKLYKEVRSDAARMLLNRDDPKIEAHLLSLVKSKEYWGIDLLAQLERNSVIEPLIEALDRGYYHAVVGLGKLKVQSVVPKLVALFGPNFAHDADLTVLRWVVTALGEIGDKRGVTLCQRGDKRDLPRLLESLECLSEENMGRSSLHLLAQFGDELVTNS